MKPPAFAKLSTPHVGRRIHVVYTGIASAWDRFWFKPCLPNVISLTRIGVGAMLLYAHLVLATDLMSFLGDEAWIDNETSRRLHDGAFGMSDWSRSYLWYISNPGVLWMHHLLTMAVTGAFMVGFLTRFSAPAAWFLQLMYLHRLTGTLFGLDQIMTYASMYVMLAPSGSCYSVDAWLRERFAARRTASRWLQWLFPDSSASVASNVATRLLQIHLCVIYLFGGLAKARGTSWWDGTAIWYAIGNYEYQSLDLTWLGAYPLIFSAISHITLFWEIFYCALVWPRLTRLWVLAMAVAVHGGIALFMGMATFGLMMIIANMIFIDPAWLTRNNKPDEKLEPLDVSLTDALDDTDDSFDEVEESLDESLDDFLAPRRKVSSTPLDEREERVRKAAKKLRSRYATLKEREAKFKKRTEKLKEREAKVRRFVAKQQDKKEASDPDQTNE